MLPFRNSKVKGSVCAKASPEAPFSCSCRVKYVEPVRRFEFGRLDARFEVEE